MVKNGRETPPKKVIRRPEDLCSDTFLSQRQISKKASLAGHQQVFASNALINRAGTKMLGSS